MAGKAARPLPAGAEPAPYASAEVCGRGEYRSQVETIDVGDEAYYNADESGEAQMIMRMGRYVVAFESVLEAKKTLTADARDVARKLAAR